VKPVIVVDGENLIFGRMASQIAKKLLTGEEIHLINSEKIVFIGNTGLLRERYLQKRRLQNKANPDHSPKWPKVPHMFVKRLVRGMLPWKRMRGRAAYKRLFVYTGNPKDLKCNLKFENAQFDRTVSKYTTVKELCRAFGYSS
jgi:large subunit ribosomal protein L13